MEPTISIPSTYCPTAREHWAQSTPVQKSRATWPNAQAARSYLHLTRHKPGRRRSPPASSWGGRALSAMTSTPSKWQVKSWPWCTVSGLARWVLSCLYEYGRLSLRKHARAHVNFCFSWWVAYTWTRSGWWSYPPYMNSVSACRLCRQCTSALSVVHFAFPRNTRNGWHGVH